MDSSIELEINNIKSACDRLLALINKNPEYIDNSDVKEGLEDFAAEFDDFVSSHTGDN